MLKKNSVINIKGINISNKHPITLISGPCQIESYEHAIYIASILKDITDDCGINFIYKSSFDKANRTSLYSSRGIGLERSLPIFQALKEQFNFPILTDVHENKQCEIISSFVDIIQIPAFLCRQTDLLIAAAKTKCIINIKKGQFLAPWDMKNVVRKIIDNGNLNVMVCERGTSFGYNNLITDMRSIPIMKKLNLPVIFDATHAVQQPGLKGTSSGGENHFVETLAYAASAIGVAGIFLETHESPKRAPSDGTNMVKIKDLKNILKKIILFDKIAKEI